MCAAVRLNVRVCVCVSVCVREREREGGRERKIEADRGELMWQFSRPLICVHRSGTGKTLHCLITWSLCTRGSFVVALHPSRITFERCRVGVQYLLSSHIYCIMVNLKCPPFSKGHVSSDQQGTYL
jgi:hypothetical protein